MAKVTQADKMRSSIMSLLEGYVEDVEGATDKAIDATARQTVKQLRNYRPNGAEKYGSWDAYLKGWTSQQEKGSKYAYKRIIHNKRRYMLAHLLERGHRMKNGQMTKAYVHIEIAEDKAKTILEKQIEKEVGKL